MNNLAGQIPFHTLPGRWPTADKQHRCPGPGETPGGSTLVEAAASVVGQRQLLHGAQDRGGGGGSLGLQHKHGLAHPVLRAQPARDGQLLLVLLYQ